MRRSVPYGHGLVNMRHVATGLFSTTIAMSAPLAGVGQLLEFGDRLLLAAFTTDVTTLISRRINRWLDQRKKKS